MVPSEPLSAAFWLLVGGCWTVWVSSGADCGSGANGLLCANAAAGAERASAARQAAIRPSIVAGNLASFEQALQPDGVARREALPVVVEVHERVAAVGERRDARRPLLQLATRVVAAPP